MHFTVGPYELYYIFIDRDVIWICAAAFNASSLHYGTVAKSRDAGIWEYEPTVIMNYHPFRKLVQSIMNRKQESYERKTYSIVWELNTWLFIELSKSIDCIEVIHIVKCQIYIK